MRAQVRSGSKRFVAAAIDAVFGPRSFWGIMSFIVNQDGIVFPGLAHPHNRPTTATPAAKASPAPSA
jgi:hypothetical protein